MIRTSELVPVVKQLVYSIHSEETNDISEMKALLKFYRICNDTMADLLETKAKDDCNIFLLQDLFYYHSVYAKAYNFLFDSLKLTEVHGEEKEAVLQKIMGIAEIDDTHEIVEIINGLTDFQSTAAGNKELAIEEIVESQHENKTVKTDKKSIGAAGRKKPSVNKK